MEIVELRECSVERVKDDCARGSEGGFKRNMFFYLLFIFQFDRGHVFAVLIKSPDEGNIFFFTLGFFFFFFFFFFFEEIDEACGLTFMKK